MVEIKKRAISPEQKAYRRQQMLDTAAEMFMARSYEAVNMADVAKAIGITKPALYRYFRGKEVLFLALFEREIGNLMQAFLKAPKPEKVGEAVAGILASNPLYCRLCAILHTVLEKDLTYAEALAFKLNVKAAATHLGEVMQGWLGPQFDGDREGVLMQSQQALIGVWHMTHPVGAMREVLETEPELQGMCHDFEATLAAHLTALFRS
ncbi:MAG: TetR family transcriptional regulator [Alphaproteobacteria bacterium]|nr:TetR family transcriptional regulator [Alphaproteobacteria bacterium]